MKFRCINYEDVVLIVSLGAMGELELYTESFSEDAQITLSKADAKRLATEILRLTHDNGEER